MTNAAQENPLVQALFGASNNLRDLERRRRASTLAALTLPLAIALTIVIVAVQARTQDVNWAGWLIPASMWMGYVFSRTRFPEAGVVIYVMLQTAVVVVGLALEVVVFNYTIALIIPMIIASLTLPLTLAAITIGVVLAALGSIAVLVGPSLDANAALSITGTVGLLAIVTAYIRQRDVTIIRTQTHDLESYNRSLEEEVETRAANIMSIADIGRQVAESRELQPMMDQAVDLIEANFNFYHVQIFLVDDAKQWAVLRSSTGEAGRQLLARRHRLEVGSRSVIGQVTATGEPVIALDTDMDPVHRRNELLPNTRAEMALPLRASGQVIGALDVQSTEPNGFTQADIPVFQTLADQLAVAIERIRLYERTQRDLRQIEVLNRQLTGEAWDRFETGRAAPLGYRVSAENVQPITAVEDMPPHADHTLSLPLEVRGETIGRLEVTPKEDGTPPDEQTRIMLESVAERVAQALDNSRLGEQSRRQAQEEMILSRLSAELQATSDLEMILSIVAERASRTMDSSRGFIHLTMDGDERQE